MKETWKSAQFKYLLENYPSLWDSMMKEIIMPQYDNNFWLQGPANYLVQTNKVC